MTEYSKIFAALADATRRNMVERLVENDATVGELAKPYGISLQAVSRHLKVLQEAGLIRRPGGGHRSPVRLEEDALGPAAQWIEEFYNSRLRSKNNDITGEIIRTANPAPGEFVVVREFPFPLRQLHRIRTDPELYVQWISPPETQVRIMFWDPRPGGRWRLRFIGDSKVDIYGTFHEYDPGWIVQMFTIGNKTDNLAISSQRAKDVGGDESRMSFKVTTDNLEVWADFRRRCYPETETNASDIHGEVEAEIKEAFGRAASLPESDAA
ncbi:putative transcriptional regulator [Frankia casuarinae]|jgi:DNA-binding transcriptional ArsR family regulator/uncharacterized protein YndB with AHSA1/START domain|uniref:Transcriptional regulator, ArsR family n=1 Tax=Frankia casuarinae (strain DSM 45818 / CECT 9043 / HFP020203 / CcI3) TaxID=106370 RepID=Q2JEC3_FRACC|nr:MULTISPECIES: metalloregulator ArsR/SmtB family transcription factor [Frankia]ABD10369.1 transcriptional regulator, ArsR family [Frankia casuarinae]ESZ99703.1 putative transcriptional regulator [Frankia sp. CcI6]EYT91666.1 putative transcriptional regulator [Frankia casuarinae]KDA41975.1 putative transcriptional regulator [Frankia sp. BMG5.23]TFE30163.1 metalloregulator ArsR/SmtB family transcription factor [Frankia sp. B2]